jgi:hypothetical protein
MGLMVFLCKIDEVPKSFYKVYFKPHSENTFALSVKECLTYLMSLYLRMLPIDLKSMLSGNLISSIDQVGFFKM